METSLMAGVHQILANQKVPVTLIKQWERDREQGRRGQPMRRALVTQENSNAQENTD